MTGKKIDLGNEKEVLETAKFYFLNRKYEKAVEEFKKVLKLNPGNADAYYNLGLIYENRNDVDGAKKMYERALDIDESNKLARTHLNKLIGISNE